MKHLLLIAIGGAGGALCRHALMNMINVVAGGKFPFGTLAVNIIGSFFIGIVYVIIIEKIALHPDWRHVLMVGFLGAFTTFSTFSLEAITLLENGQVAHAGVYVLSSVMVCLLSTWAAITMARFM